MKHRWFVLLMVVLLFAACSAATPASPEGEAQAVEPGGGSADRSPLGEPGAPISPSSTPELQTGGGDAVVARVRSLVGEKVGVSPEDLTLVSVEPVTWSDTSLGCPQPGMGYAQVLVPGWRVVFADPAGRQYDVHTAEDGETFVICDAAASKPQPTTPEPAKNPAVAAAITMLAEHLGVAEDTISVISVEAVEWPNSCLGCESPGKVCLAVVTPGYQVRLQSGKALYDVRTDRTGRYTILCEGPGRTPVTPNPLH